MSGGHTDTSKQAAILTDTTKCVGCQKCVKACVETNKTGDPVPYIRAHPDGLSGTRWTSVLRVRDEEQGISRFVRKQCLHCVEASCVSACLVGAMQKQDNGPVIYDADRCIGCRYCMVACPYKIPRSQWDTWMPFINKCIMCYERLEEGKPPACTAACPYGATIFGTREELLAEAKHRIAKEPDLYIDRVWGEHEFGGTNVFYVSDVSLEDLGFPKELNEANTISIPEKNWPIVSATPFVFTFVYSGLLLSSFVISRRMKLQKEREEAAKSSHFEDEII